MSRGLAIAGVAGGMLAAAIVLQRAAAASSHEGDPLPPGPAPEPDGSTPAPAPPEEWARWHGASPEPMGSPGGTILAVPGLRSVEPMARAGLLNLCAELGIPCDALAIVIASESGWNPRAMNPLPAAGLIQLTVGAHLAGFNTAEKVRAIADLSAAEQLVNVLGPYYRRVPQARGATPGKLCMLNFLPAHAGKPESFVLARKGAAGTEGDVYARNAGFDTAKKGSITVGDVYASAARVAARAARARLTVSGDILPGDVS